MTDPAVTDRLFVRLDHKFVVRPLEVALKMRRSVEFVEVKNISNESDVNLVCFIF